MIYNTVRKGMVHMSEEAKKIITIGLLAFAAIAWLWPLLLGMQLEAEAKKKRGDPPDYDERQKLFRLRAGNHALYALLAFLIVWTAADQLGKFRWSSSVLDMTICGLVLAWCIWSAECILHDALITWKDKRKDADALPLAYAWMIPYWTSPAFGVKICNSWAPFIFGCIDIAVLFTVVIYKAWKRKKTKAEEMP